MNVIFENLISIAAQRQENPGIPAFETKTEVLKVVEMDALPNLDDEVRVKGESYYVNRFIWHIDGDRYETSDENVYPPYVVVRVS